MVKSLGDTSICTKALVKEKSDNTLPVLHAFCQFLLLSLSWCHPWKILFVYLLFTYRQNFLPLCIHSKHLQMKTQMWFKGLSNFKLDLDIITTNFWTRFHEHLAQLITKRQNFRLVQIESTCRRLIECG